MTDDFILQLQELRRGDRAAAVPDAGPQRDRRPPPRPRLRHERRRKTEQVVDVLRQEEVPQERAQEVDLGEEEEMPKIFCYALHLMLCMFFEDQINSLLTL